MADDQNIRALLGGGGDRIATAHLLFGAAFLVLGGAIQALALFALRFDGLFPVSFGRLEPMGNLGLIIGFGAMSLIGGVYYTLPRLTGARLWGEDLAGMGLVGLVGLTLVGLAVIGLGLGDGRAPLSLPWWLDIPMLAVLAVPMLVTIGTVRQRFETRSYVSVWFILGGVVWLPGLYLLHLAGDLPGLSAVTVAYSNVVFEAGFVTMVVYTLGTGLAYYTVVKELDVPLASRALALIGFWSLGFAAVWWGTAQLLFGPGPDWMAGVTAALGLAFPIGALVNAANVSLTLSGSWAEMGERPGVTSTVVGLYLGVGVAALAALAGFRSIAAVTSMTAFWEAIQYGALSGVAPLLIAGVAFTAIPRMAGRELHSTERARSFVRLTVAGSVGVLVTLGGAGLIAGYSWIAGSNSAAFTDAGEGWGTAAGGFEALSLIALGFALVTLLGQLAYLSAVFGTVTRGRASTQETLVPVESPR